MALMTPNRPSCLPHESIRKKLRNQFYARPVEWQVAVYTLRGNLAGLTMQSSYP
jgi:hypothetical protein